VLKASEQDFRFKFRSLLEGYTKQLTESEDDTRKAAQFAGQAEQIRNAMANDAAGHESAPAARPDTPRETPLAPTAAATPAAPAAALAQAPTPDAQPAAAARHDEATRSSDHTPDGEPPAARAARRARRVARGARCAASRVAPRARAGADRALRQRSPGAVPGRPRRPYGRRRQRGRRQRLQVVSPGCRAAVPAECGSPDP